MKSEFIEANIVILGKFNPVIFDKSFFLKNDLLQEVNIIENIFTPNFARITTNELIITIDNSQVVIVNKNILSSLKIKNIAKSIIDISKNEIDIIGFNYKWFLLIDSIYECTKNQFYFKENSLNKHFNSDKTAFGYYISDDYEDSRLKLDIKPNILQDIRLSKTQNVISFDFNFHIEKKSETTIENGINNYKLYTDKALKIVSEYE